MEDAPPRPRPEGFPTTFSWQWLDRTGVLATYDAIPCLSKFVEVQSSPFSNQAQGSGRERACVDASVGDDDQCLLACVVDVKVRRVVIPPIHVDHQAVERG
jgi:hypothetical protein